MFRNTAPLNYPYPIGDVGKITTSSFGDDYYYFFYDWKIKKEDFECISDRTAVPVIITATEEGNEKKSISIFPNPTTGLLTVEIKGSVEGLKYIRLMDPIGKEVWRHDIDFGQTFRFDLHSIPSGIYSLQVFGDRFFEERKLMKN